MRQPVNLAAAVILSGCFILVGRASVGASTTLPTPVSTVSATAQPTAPATASNPFGVLIGLNSQDRVTVVQSLGVAFFRTNQAIVVDHWNGSCSDCDLAGEIGLKLILTVRANGGGPQNPSAPPADLTAYQKNLTDILSKYPPAVLAVENEENSAIFYSGTPTDYAAELQAACTVAHQNGIKCANGGMVSDDVALLVWDSYFETGDSAKACDFAKRTFRPSRVNEVCGLKKIEQLTPAVKADLAKDKALLQVYKTSGADYMNFHWYIADPQALAEAVAFLQQAVGLPLMSNEMGQQDDDPATVKALLTKSLALKLAYVIWFSGNQTQKSQNNADKVLQPTPLINDDNSLRPTGEAFKAFMQSHFGGS